MYSSVMSSWEKKKRTGWLVPLKTNRVLSFFKKNKNVHCPGMQFLSYLQYHNNDDDDIIVDCVSLLMEANSLTL